MNLAKGQLSETAHAFEAVLYEEEEIHCTVEEAWRHKHWQEAMLKEMGALERNGTWEKCKIRDGKRAVGQVGVHDQTKARWIYREIQSTTGC